ncbi:tRNA 4-thiouridine(8) synthase ThiI [Candidatus Omnitrophota bacterium]
MKAFALISGGLDSRLAAKLISDQGIEVIKLNFKIPFRFRDKNPPNPDQELLRVELREEFLQLIRNPAHGYGSNMNPCIDCKILMLKKAKELMPEADVKFVVTGEVLGQRPMSQNRQALETIARESGLEGLILRPLSAKLLPETIPEKQGWVNREKLFDYNGRNRRPQMELAERLNIREYAQPAGGCLLTDPGFAVRIKDLMRYGKLNPEGVELLKLGRHFRLSDKAKLVVGRDEGENHRIVSLAEEGDYIFSPGSELAGPSALGRGEFCEELIRLSCGITCRYCDLNGDLEADIQFYRKSESGRKHALSSLRAAPVDDAQLKSLRI